MAGNISPELHSENAKIKILSRIFCWDTEEVDVAIVGGGIAGLTLAKSGRGRGEFHFI